MFVRITPPRWRARAALLAAGAAGACATNEPDRAAAVVRVPAAVVPLGGYFAPAPDDPHSVIVAHDARGFYAFSNGCTRTACKVDPDSGLCTGVLCVVDPPAGPGAPCVCRCHGAEYTANGDTLDAGPNADADAGPYAPLRHYPITVEGAGATATLAIDTSVEQTQRGATVQVAP